MKRQAGKEKNRVSRRDFMRISAAAAAGFLPVIAASAAFAGSSAVRAGDREGGRLRQTLPADFQRVSQFLTGKEISPLLAQRAWDALNVHDRDFVARYSALAGFLHAAKAPNIDALKGQTSFQGPRRQTAQDIISAYYLGYVGTPEALSARDDVVFITYTQALMYQLTYEHTPIPTYSRWGSGFWAKAVNPR